MHKLPNGYGQKSASGKVSEYANSVAADALGNSYMIGQFDDTLYFGTTSLISTVNGNLFIAKMQFQRVMYYGQKV